GSGAGAAAFAFNNMYTSPNLVGLSAAVSALFGAFVRLPMPGRILPLPLLDTKVTRFSIGFLLLHVVLAVIIPPGFENVAWDAHIAGFLIGLLLVPIFLKRP
ncbi:MAG: rhomboid family intramembrane serine protease, partial [Alphaproteobacteria bacterium]